MYRLDGACWYGGGGHNHLLPFLFETAIYTYPMEHFFHHQKSLRKHVSVFHIRLCTVVPESRTFKTNFFVFLGNGEIGELNNPQTECISRCLSKSKPNARRKAYLTSGHSILDGLTLRRHMTYTKLLYFLSYF